MTVVGLLDVVKVSNSADADHVHRRSGVHNKSSFLMFKSWWCRQAPIFRRWEECCFDASPSILWYFWPTSTLLHGPIALAIPSLPETDPKNLEHWGYAHEVHLGKSFQADSCLEMLAWRTTALVNWTHRIGFRMFQLFRKIDEDFGGSIFWNTQPNCRVIFSIATALLSPFFEGLLL